MDDLYLYLPSSVKNKEIDNTISHFTTKLSTPIHLSEGWGYEVALVKLIYPSTAMNIYDGQLEFYSFAIKRIDYGRIPAGFYKLPENFINAFNVAIGDEDRKYYKLTSDITRKIFILECSTPAGDKTKPQIHLSQNLQAITGLNEKMERGGTYTSDATWDVTGGLHNMYLYSDAIKNTNIGNTVAPVLSVVSYRPDSEFQVEYQPKNLIYLPLSTDFIQTVLIEVTTKTGQYFPFSSGELLVVLHIRARRSRL